MNAPKPAQPKPYGERVIDELMDGLAQLADEARMEGDPKPTPAGPAMHNRAQRRAAGVAAAHAARRPR